MTDRHARALALIAAFAAPALHAQATKWTCTERGHGSGSPDHVALQQPATLPGIGEGRIPLLNIRHPAWTSAQGLELRWDWDDPDDEEPGSRYSFVIDSSGSGRYFDFGLAEKNDDGVRTAQARSFFTCSRAAADEPLDDRARALLEKIRAAREQAPASRDPSSTTNAPSPPDP